MKDTDSIKALENQAANTRHLVERLTRAAYGMTFPELIKALGGKEEEHGRNKDISAEPGDR